MNQQIVKTEPRDYLDIISKVASVKDVDVDKLERLMQMQVELEKRQAALYYNEQMSRAQGEMGQISKDSANTQTRSKYASLEALDEAIRPIYTRNGFSIEFNEEHPGERADGVVLSIYVSCGAETRRRTKYIPITTTGIKGTTMMTPTHASIGAVTYGRRALLKMVFNLAEADTDGDLGKFDRMESGRPENPDPPKYFTVDEMIEQMRAQKTHTDLYTYAQDKTHFNKLSSANQKLVGQIYKQLMDEFDQQMKSEEQQKQ